MKEVFLSKAQSLAPSLYHQRIEAHRIGEPAALREKEFVVFDFGNHYVGHVSFDFSYEGHHPDAPAYLRFTFCENERELHENIDEYNGWVSKSWIQDERIHLDVLPCVMTMPRRYAFRYVRIEVLCVSSRYSLVVNRCWADATTSADDSAISPIGRDGDEKQVDIVSLRTLRSCMQDVFEDGPKRDRRLWMGDLRLQAQANASTYRNFDLVRRCLYLFAGTVNEEGRIAACLFTTPHVEADDTYMFDYSLFFATTLCDYFDATMDVETTRDLFDTAHRQVMLAKNCFDENHVLRDSDKMGWCFVDWNLHLNKQAAGHAIYIYCVRQMRILCEKLGKAELATEMQKEIALKTAAAQEHFFCKKQGLFVSGESRQISWASQVWMVLAQVFSQKESAKVLERIAKIPDAQQMVTPYMMHHYIEALVSAGQHDKAYQEMLHYWGGMVKQGADTFWELYNPANPEESPYGGCAINSYCHAWSCTPSYLLRKYFVSEACMDVS